METQSSLMQLFMSLGTQNATSGVAGDGLLGLGGNQFNSVYDEVLQGLQGDSGADPLGQLPGSLSELNVVNSEEQQSLLTQESSEGEAEQTLQMLPMDGQALPLAEPQVANSFPQVKPSQLDTAGLNPMARAIAASSSELKKVSSELADNTAMIDSDVQDSQAVEYRQQMISNILQTNPVQAAASAEKLQSAALPLSGLRPEVRGGLNPSQSNRPSALTTEESIPPELDGESPDRFLGAESFLKPTTTQVIKQAGVESGLAGQSGSPNVPAQLTSAEAQVAVQEPEALLEDDLQLTAELDQQRELKADIEKSLQLNKGQQAWGDAISERITMAAAKDVQQATIHLDPPELGAMELKLEVNEDRQTQVQVQVQNPQVKEALESSATRLREMLEKEGLQLANLDVSDQGQQQQQGDSDSSSQAGDGFMTDAEDIETEAPRTVRVSENLLDTYV